MDLPQNTPSESKYFVMNVIPGGFNQPTNHPNGENQQKCSNHQLDEYQLGKPLQVGESFLLRGR